MSKFKIGDKVKILSDFLDKKAGDIGTVTNIDIGGETNNRCPYWVKFGPNDEYPAGYCCETTNLELITVTAKIGKGMSKYKIGDKVRVLDINEARVTIGMIGTVESTPNYDDGNYTVRFLKDAAGHNDFWYFQPEHLELVTVTAQKTKVTYLLTKGSITLHYDGKTKVVAKDDARFEQVLQAIRDGKLDSIPGIVELERALVGKGLEVEDGMITLNGKTMPTELTERIIAYKENNLPFHSLELFWENLSKNPSFNSRKELFKFLENKGHSITEDGCFIGYRGVRADFKDKHSGKFDNTPGSTCEVSRDSVDDNPNNDCSYGLHVGGYEYAKDFGNGGRLVLVKVNPKDVVAVPSTYNGQKMRVCKFEVLKEVVDFVPDPVVTPKGEKSTAKVEAEPTAWTKKDKDVYSYKVESVFWDDAEGVEKSAQLKKRIPNYANNHNKRGKDGKFAPKKKAARKSARKGK